MLVTYNVEAIFLRQQSIRSNMVTLKLIPPLENDYRTHKHIRTKLSDIETSMIRAVNNSKSKGM